MTPTRRPWLLILLIALGLARIALTYTTLNSTSDEPAQTAAGMEVLQFGTYTYEMQHPPLARIALALGPHLAGLRLPAHRNVEREGFMTVYQDGNEILYADGRYWRNLTLARLGALPFFVLMCVVAYAWAERWVAPRAGLWAAGLVVCTPPVLGHAGLATVDAACGAMTVLALYALLRWMEQPGARRAALFGLAVAGATLVKFSSVPFVGGCFLASLFWKRPKMTELAIATGAGLLALWAGYGFDTGTLGPVWGPHPKIDSVLERAPFLRPAWDLAMNTPLPFPKLLLGMRDVARHNGLGHASYLFGEWRMTGWWYFFPVVLAVKAPLGLLILTGVALWRLETWQQKASAIFAATILAVCLPSQIDLGVRHILAIFPVMAVIASRAMKHGRFAVALAGLVAVESLWAHPDYMAHFNPLVAGRPERVLAESDLDWGQDLDRLARRLRELKVEEVHIKYFGSALLEKAGLPTYWDLDARNPVKGWVAISTHYLYLEHAKDGSFDWLKRYTPREKIGKSIDLFFIE